MNVDECAREWGNSFIHSFVCLYKCAINCCLFIFYYIFVYFDFCFLHNFCRLTRMFFYNALPAFCSTMGRKYRDKLCVYMYLMAMHLYLFSVFLLCLNFLGALWRSGSGKREETGGFLYDMRMKSIRSMLVCCSLLFVVVVYVVIALDNLFCKFCKPLKNIFSGLLFLSHFTAAQRAQRRKQLFR